MHINYYKRNIGENVDKEEYTSSPDREWNSSAGRFLW